MCLVYYRKYCNVIHRVTKTNWKQITVLDWPVKNKTEPCGPQPVNDPLPVKPYKMVKGIYFFFNFPPPPFFPPLVSKYCRWLVEDYTKLEFYKVQLRALLLDTTHSVLLLLWISMYTTLCSIYSRLFVGVGTCQVLLLVVHYTNISHIPCMLWLLLTVSVGSAIASLRTG